VRRYALRNALAPSVQVFAQNIQYLVGGIVVTEYLFAYPGIGKELVDAVAIRDVREVQSIALVVAAIYIGINIVADLLVVLLVPRLRTRA
jgi:peptide/nickel transport system permease protein